MSAHLLTHLVDTLTRRQSEGALRSLINLSEMIDFASNDYLGLARDPRLHREIETEVSNLSPQLGARLHGSAASRLVSGNCSYIEQIEDELARFYRAEAGLFYSSGYQANLGLLSCLVPRTGCILYDAEIHASMVDALQLSYAKAYSFRHNDLNHLEERLRGAPSPCVVAIESLYSMGGDEAPLEAMVVLCERYGAALIVDEAHASGIYGPQGEGLCVAQGMENRVFARVHTFGKAIGCHGAVVVSNKTLRDYLINFSRSFIYSTAPALSQFAAARAAHRLLPTLDRQRQELRARIHHFLAHPLLRVSETGPKAGGQIQAVYCPGSNSCAHLASVLRERGFGIKAMLAPTVRAGTERLRVCLHSYNSLQEIDSLLNNVSLLQNLPL